MRYHLFAKLIRDPQISGDTLIFELCVPASRRQPLGKPMRPENLPGSSRERWRYAEFKDVLFITENLDHERSTEFKMKAIHFKVKEISGKLALDLIPLIKQF
jgi:hypothetical protein